MTPIKKNKNKRVCPHEQFFKKKGDRIGRLSVSIVYIV